MRKDRDSRHLASLTGIRKKAVRNLRVGSSFLLLIIIVLVLFGWQFPGILGMLPAGWNGMQANTAFLLFLAWLNTELSLYRQFRLQLVLSMVAVVLLADGVWSHLQNFQETSISRFFVAEANASDVYAISIQSMVMISLLFLMPFFRNNKTRWQARIFNFLLINASGLLIFFAVSSLFQATIFLGSNQNIYISGYTQIALVLLTLVNATNSTQKNIFSVIISKGAGGRISRVALLLVVCTVLMGALLLVILVFSGMLQLNAAVSLVVSLELVMLFLAIIYLSERINFLENNMHQNALSDQMTGVLNRRGFYLFAEQAMREVRRGDFQLKMYLFDLDGLKKVNDTFGHEIGSAMISAFADTLRTVFRSSDIVARLGGDEFVVMKKTGSASGHEDLFRLNKALNESSGMAYGRISFSVGELVVAPDSEETLDELCIGLT
jgi:diguanylate cyclase (GGDEF)-like protein